MSDSQKHLGDQQWEGAKHQAKQKVGQSVKRKAQMMMVKMGKKALAFLATKAILLVKLILVKTAPIWGTFLVIFGVVSLAYLLIVAVPKMMVEHTFGRFAFGATEDIDDVEVTEDDLLQAFFGFSDRDMEGYEGLFDTYREVVQSWDEDLTEEQVEQVQMYEMSWGILAGVDRMRADPILSQGSRNDLTLEFEGQTLNVSNYQPPPEFIPIYKDAARRYNVDWEVLASVHYHESSFSRYPLGKISYRGARGPMQFMISTFLGWNFDGNDIMSKKVAENGNFYGDFVSNAGYSDRDMYQFIGNPNNISRYGGYGVDATGNGIADIYDETDAIHSAANYLSQSGYSRSPESALLNYNHSEEYVRDILMGAQVIHHIESDQDDDSSTEIVIDDQSDFDFFDLSNSFRILPRPEATFEDLRPQFDWKTSETITTYEEEVCRMETVDTDTGNNLNSLLEEGQRESTLDQMTEEIEVCTWEPREERNEVLLVTHAHTYMGTFEHDYERTTRELDDTTNGNGNRIRNKRISQEEMSALHQPQGDEYLEPLYAVLESYGIDNESDVELTMQLIEIYDETFNRNNDLINAIDHSSYEVIENSDGWIWPSPSQRITSGFGTRVHPVTGETSFHSGVDVGAVSPGIEGDPIYAMDDGVVEIATYHSAAGYYINIRHDNNVLTRYLHLQSRLLVGPNDSVQAGDIIGYMGNTGTSTAAHLHFEIHVNNQARDPMFYFNN